MEVKNKIEIHSPYKSIAQVDSIHYGGQGVDINEVQLKIRPIRLQSIA